MPPAMPGTRTAPAANRSLTFSSLAASFSSVAPCRYRRCPFSMNTARHGSPAASGGYSRGACPGLD